MAGKSKLQEVVIPVGKCAKCGSTSADTTNITRTEYDGQMLVRRWKRCLKCDQRRIERSVESL